MIVVGTLTISLIFSVIFWIITLITSLISSEIDLPPPHRCLASIIIPSFAMVWGYKKKSLNISGVVAGTVIGFLLTISNFSFIVCLLTFFISSSKATKFKSQKKALFEDDFKDGGQRNWVQVICNGGIAAEMATLYMIEIGLKESTVDFTNNYFGSWFAISVLATLSGVNGDTWASEFGSVLSRNDPLLITTLKRVPKGTNGGISFAGLLASFLGGTLIGFSYYFSLLFFINQDELSGSSPQWPVILIGGFAGFFGSFIDSLLGATMQFSGLNTKSGKIVERPGQNVNRISGMPLLDNHSVNLISSFLTAVFVPFLAIQIWPSF